MKGRIAGVGTKMLRVVNDEAAKAVEIRRSLGSEVLEGRAMPASEMTAGNGQGICGGDHTQAQP